MTSHHVRARFNHPSHLLQSVAAEFKRYVLKLRVSFLPKATNDHNKNLRECSIATHHAVISDHVRMLVGFPKQRDLAVGQAETVADHSLHCNATSVETAPETKRGGVNHNRNIDLCTANRSEIFATTTFASFKLF